MYNDRNDIDELNDLVDQGFMVVMYQTNHDTRRADVIGSGSKQEILRAVLSSFGEADYSAEPDGGYTFGDIARVVEEQRLNEG